MARGANYDQASGQDPGNATASPRNRPSRAGTIFLARPIRPYARNNEEASGGAVFSSLPGAYCTQRNRRRNRMTHFGAAGHRRTCGNIFLVDPGPGAWIAARSMPARKSSRPGVRRSGPPPATEGLRTTSGFIFAALLRRGPLGNGSLVSLRSNIALFSVRIVHPVFRRGVSRDATKSAARSSRPPVGFVHPGLVRRLASASRSPGRSRANTLHPCCLAGEIGRQGAIGAFGARPVARVSASSPVVVFRPGSPRAGML